MLTGSVPVQNAYFFKSSHVEECSRKRHKGVSVVANVSLTNTYKHCLFVFSKSDKNFVLCLD